MSASVDTSAIFLTDTAVQIENKINNHAFSGGGATTEEHKANGGDCDIDTPFQLLTFFLEDGDKLECLRKGYSSGELLPEEMKREAIEVLQKLVGDYQQRLAEVTDEMVKTYMRADKFPRSTSRTPRVQTPVQSKHITWHEYFMSVALLAARRSKDPSTQVGACIVNNQNKIVATGYNGMPNGVHDDLVPWTKEGPFLETKYAYVVHAELNAILNSVLTDQTGCRIYVSLFPCNECAKAIIQTGIRHVIYLSDKHQDKEATKAAKIMFRMANVLCEQYSSLGSPSNITITIS